MATRQEEARRWREAKLEELHGRVAGAVERLVTGEDWADALRFAARFRKRSFNNVLLIWGQHQAAFEAGKVPTPFPTYVAGEKQWARLGREVMDGQEPYWILAPWMTRFASVTPDDPGSWRILRGRAKPRPGETVRTKMTGAKPVKVYDVSQTVGDPLPERPQPALMRGEAPAGLKNGIVGLIRAEGFEYVEVPDEGVIDGASGRTDYTTRQVEVAVNVDEAEQVLTRGHELAHVKMHGPDQKEARQHRGIGEVEAESVALMVCAAHGMDTTDASIPYVAGWAAAVDGKNPVEVVLAAGERIRTTALDILDRLDTDQVSNGIPPGLAQDAPQQRAPERDQSRTVSVPDPEEARPELAAAGRGL